MKKNNYFKKKINPKFSFFKALKEVSFKFPERSQKIIEMRFGISGKGPQTLEFIGNHYQVSRERVRQIIKEIIRKVKLGKNRVCLETAFEKIEFVVEKNNGIISKKELLAELGEDQKERGAIEFILNCADKLECKKEKEKLEDSVILAGFDFKFWEEIIEKTKLILEEEKKVFTEDQLFKKVTEKGMKIGRKEFFCYISVSKEIRKNNFGKWGLAHWSEINPKGTREKTLLVMKEVKKPLHYSEVAKLIERYKLNKRAVHPQTVHNELIKGDDFVLVGRGRYALKEWGYKKGTVKDVLEELLSKQRKPMEREEIVNKVLALREVKASTVVVNLNNFFEKVSEDEYTVRKSF